MPLFSPSQKDLKTERERSNLGGVFGNVRCDTIGGASCSGYGISTLGEMSHSSRTRIWVDYMWSPCAWCATKTASMTPFNWFRGENERVAERCLMHHEMKWICIQGFGWEAFQFKTDVTNQERPKSDKGWKLIADLYRTFFARHCRASQLRHWTRTYSSKLMMYSSRYTKPKIKHWDTHVPSPQMHIY